MIGRGALAALTWPAVRRATTLACLVLMGAVLWSWLRDRSERAELETVIETYLSGEARADAIHEVRREPSLHHAGLAVARGLVVGVLEADPRPADAGDRLRIARGLAAEALAVQPGSWQGAMWLGVTVYLDRLIRRDTALATAADDWQDPLLHARELAPGRREPRRFLVAAYLETWRNLSPARRERARELLAEAFAEDPDAFAGLLPTWLAVAADTDEAFAPIPDRPEAWFRLEQVYAERQAWEPFCRAHGRRLDALEQRLAEDLDEAERRLRLGDHFGGRSILLRVVSQAPRDTRFAASVARALERYPAGLHGLASTQALGEWLGWTLELHLVGHDPLPANVVGRLAGAAGTLEAPDAALAALVAGEVHRAEQLERQTERLGMVPWADYLVAKAQWHLDRGEAEPARVALDTVARLARRRAVYWLVRERVDRALGDLVDLAKSRDELAAFRRDAWSTLDWQSRPTGAALTLFAGAPARGIAIEMLGVPASGAVVELVWDGRAVEVRPVAPRETVELAVDVGAGLHLLEVRSLAGAQVEPGETRLLGAASEEGAG